MTTRNNYFKPPKNPLFWPRPIVPLRFQSSIVSAVAFQDSVRDGESWFHHAQKTRTQGFNMLKTALGQVNVNTTWLGSLKSEEKASLRES